MNSNFKWTEFHGLELNGVTWVSLLCCASQTFPAADQFSKLELEVDQVEIDAAHRA